MTLLPLLNHINDLKRLPRMGWLLAGIAPVESVADHAFATALVALSLAEAVNAALDSTQLSAPLEIGRVLRIALVHDLAESLLTDLPHRATALLSANAKHGAERTAMAQIMADVPDGAAWIALWEEYAAGSSPEARLVRDADKVELAHQALRYTQTGVRGLNEFVHAPTFYYAQAAALHAEIADAFAGGQRIRAPKGRLVAVAAGVPLDCAHSGFRGHGSFACNLLHGPKSGILVPAPKPILSRRHRSHCALVPLGGSAS